MNDMAVHYSSDKSDWGTPRSLFDFLDDIFKFTADACADETNALCKTFWSETNSFLDWYPADERETIFMNPPYGSGIKSFVDHLAAISYWGTIGIALIPARTDTKWFQTVWSHAHAIVFMRGRIKFVGAPHGAPFPSCIAVFGRVLTDTERSYLSQLGCVVVLR